MVMGTSTGGGIQEGEGGVNKTHCASLVQSVVIRELELTELWTVVTIHILIIIFWSLLCNHPILYLYDVIIIV